MLFHSIFFYFFSFVAVSSALLVILSRNTVYSVLFLILVFISISILFIMIGAEFLGMIILIVYVGAVSVLFLFVVMMLNVSQQKLTENVKNNSFINNVSVASVVGVIIFLELLIVISGWKYKDTFNPLLSDDLNKNISNTHELGNIIYTDHIHLFQISGIILLIAMIGAITLTFSKRENVKRQNYFHQIQRDKSSAVNLVEVENDKGIKLDD